MDFVEEFETAIHLWADGDIVKSLAERSNSDIYEFSETLSLISRHYFKPNRLVNTNFSFTANSALSGGRYPCSSPDCRLNKIEQMASFAALYADEVYIHDPFENVVLRGPDGVNEIQRQELISGVLNFFLLKPLFEKGLIKYAKNLVRLCSHHKESFADPLLKEIEEKEDILYDLFYEYLIERCSLTFDLKSWGEPFIEIKGPENLIEHGVRYFYLYPPLPEFVKAFKKKKLPYTISRSEIDDIGLLSLIISPILRDLSSLEWHSAFAGTSYLCDNPVQIKLASKLNSDKYSADSSAFEKAMQHYLPAVYGSDMKTLLELRDRESESFSVYRDRLTSMLKETKSWSEEEVSEVFRDQVLPEINRIEKSICDWKSNIRESLKEKIIFGSGAVTIGLYAGILPPNIGQIVAALGGSSAIASLLIDYNRSLKDNQEARKNDFYFLWQARK